MIRISNIKLRPDMTGPQLQHALTKAIIRKLKLKQDARFDFAIKKQSLDARKKPDIFYVYSVHVRIAGIKEKALIAKLKDAQVTYAEESSYHADKEICANGNPAALTEEERPVIVGFGPAGMFAGLILARNGLRPLILERGESVEQRHKTVEQFWNNGTLNPESNVQFGEGGAGTFSDGKLNTGVKDVNHRIEYVLETFVRAGADRSILYANKPHIGTDVLTRVVKNIREEILSLGGEIHFQTRLDNLIIEGDMLKGIQVTKHTCNEQGESVSAKEEMVCRNLILALGHSARDTFAMLCKHPIEMHAKAFAMGLRMEHPQALINQNAYGETKYDLPAADYKLTFQTSNGRGVYSFCMCPGGYVVNASSEDGRTAVNGMSYSGRNGDNANSALIVTVTPEDYSEFGTDALAGVRFQQHLEELAYREGNGKVPVQLSADFAANRITTALGTVTPNIKGEYAFANLRNVLPEYISESILEGIAQFEHQIKGYAMPDAVLAGIESRTSSPVRIVRDNETFQSSIHGIFPCGEGAGYAGGITSAAVDGIKVSEKLLLSCFLSKKQE